MSNTTCTNPNVPLSKEEKYAFYHLHEKKMAGMGEMSVPLRICKWNDLYHLNIQLKIRTGFRDRSAGGGAPPIFLNL